MLVYYYLYGRCTRTVPSRGELHALLPPVHAPAPARGPAAQTGWFCWVKEARGQWVPTVATYFLLGGDTFLRSCRPPQPPPSPIPAPTPGKLTVTQRGLWSLRLIELLRVACHFCACGLQICLTKRATPPPGRGGGRSRLGGQLSLPRRPGTVAWGPRSTHLPGDRGGFHFIPPPPPVRGGGSRQRDSLFVNQFNGRIDSKFHPRVRRKGGMRKNCIFVVAPKVGGGGHLSRWEAQAFGFRDGQSLRERHAHRPPPADTARR